MASKRRRGTAIVETSKGILVVSHNNRTFYLPGGGAEKGESRKEAAIRELKEETNLQTLSCSFLFEYDSLNNSHKVFSITSTGIAKPSNEIQFIDYFNGSNLKVSNTVWEILDLYKAIKITKAFLKNGQRRETKDCHKNKLNKKNGKAQSLNRCNKAFGVLDN